MIDNFIEYGIYDHSTIIVLQISTHTATVRLCYSRGKSVVSQFELGREKSCVRAFQTVRAWRFRVLWPIFQLRKIPARRHPAKAASRCGKGSTCSPWRSRARNRRRPRPAFHFGYSYLLPHPLAQPSAFFSLKASECHLLEQK